MSNLFPSYVTVNPSLILPEILMQYTQASGAFDLLYTGDPMVRLGEGDQYVYVKKLELRTKVAAGQAAYNSLPSATLVASMVSTPTYLVRTRAEYDHHDTAAAGNWGVSLPEAQRLGMRQGVFQQMRNALLYGFQPSQGEGLLNTNGATAVNLPADSNGNTTVVTYDNGQMAFFILGVISAIKTRTMSLGQPARITVTGPQRILGAWEYQGIVQLTQFQRTGAGTANIADTIKMNAGEDTVEFTYDDTLIGKGAGGNDAVVVVVPEVKPNRVNRVNTNEFANLTPGLGATTVQLCDMAAPREIPTPLPGGAIDVLSELRITSGWGLRPEAITIISMQYQ